VSFPVSMGRKSVANSQACERREITRNHFLSSFDIMAGNERAAVQSPGSADRSRRFIRSDSFWVRSQKCEDQFHGHEAGNLVGCIVHRR
jgi:hypothetical protein